MTYGIPHGPRIASVLLLLGSLVGGLSCAGEPRTGTFVSMIDNQYTAAVTRVPVGARVIFMNVGANPHNAVATDSTWKTALEIKAGSEETLVFDQPGVFHYYCTFHGTRDGKGMAGVVVVGDVVYSPSPKGIIPPVALATGVTRHVPKDYPTIQAAVDAADPGDLVLVEPGVYKEEVTVTTPSLVIRGTDRNAVIIDGEFVRGNGIQVLADAVAIENMTARNARLNGFYWSNLTGFRGAWLTAYNNGDYGIYAFGAYRRSLRGLLRLRLARLGVLRRPVLPLSHRDPPSHRGAQCPGILGHQFRW